VRDTQTEWTTYQDIYSAAFRLIYSDIWNTPVSLFGTKKQEVLGRINRLLSFDTTWTAEKTTHPTIVLLLRVYSLPR
jgi:hypothetical protein